MVIARVGAVTAGAPVGQVNRLPMRPTQALSLPQAQGSSFRREAEPDPAAILNDWKKNRGGLYEDGFFGKSSIEAKDALKLLNKGEEVFVKNSFGGHDKLKSVDDLLILDGVQGSFTDYHRADPSLRLPLLFLGGQKLTTDNTKENVSYYAAYKRMQGNQPIKLNGQALSPADLAGKVIAAFLPPTSDPGSALLASVNISGGEAGWRVDGRDVSGNVLYLALLKGADRVTFNSTPVAGSDGLHLVNFMLKGLEGDALPPNLRATAAETRGRLGHLPAADRDAYSALQTLQANGAVKFGQDTVRSLGELAILDALQGDRQPVPGLAPAVQQALMALADGGLSAGGAFATHQALQAGQPVTYTFRGGPANEPIALTLTSLAGAPAIYQQVEAQRERDRHRPELADFQRLAAEKGAIFRALLDSDLAESRAARTAAQADIPRQEDVIRGAQVRYDDNARRLQEVSGRIPAAQDAERRAARSYQNARFNYDRDERDLQHLEDRYRSTEWEVRRLQQSAADADRRAVAEDQAANKPGLPQDQQNAHRQKAAQYRQQATQYHQQANFRLNELNQLRWEVERARRDLDRSRRELWQAQGDYDQAKRVLADLQREASGYQAQMDGARREMDGANAAIAKDRQVIQDADTVLGVGESLQTALRSLTDNAREVQDFDDYARRRTDLNASALQLATLSANETWRRVHGDALSSALAPIQALLAGMDRPEEPAVNFMPVLPGNGLQ